MGSQTRTRGRAGLLALPLLACMALLLAVCAAPAEAYAVGVDYIEKSWNGSQVVDTTKTADCTPITDDTEEIDGWYVVQGNINSSERLVVTGTANIVLTDGSRLYLKDGINVSAGKTLNIYAQSGGTGELYCDADTDDNAAIGSDECDGDCGTINIHGGKVTADAKAKGEDAAGIGGGEEGNGGDVTVYGGSVYAKGGSSSGEGGAGIGGGDGDDGKGGDGGTLKVYGGYVEATGGCDGAGIGGGDEGDGGRFEIWGGEVMSTGDDGAGIGGGQLGDGGTVIIHGGKVTATGGTDAAGIGGGERGNGGTFEMYAGNVSAAGGSASSNGGAGIGGGGGGNGGSVVISPTEYTTSCDVVASGGANAAGIGGGDGGNSGTVRINGHYTTVRAYGGSKYSDGGAGIGGGNDGSGETIEITDGEIYAYGGCDAAGIGGGDCGNGGTINITGGWHVTAHGGDYGAGIGGGDADGSGNGHGGTITIRNAKVYATGGTDAAGIGGGEGGSGGTIELFGGEDARIEAKGGSSKADGGAGIGSGDKDGKNIDGGKITIHGGAIIAKGGPDAAGIGGGNGCNGGQITIENGTVEATGGVLGAGIGGGQDGSGGNISIRNGAVTATGGSDAAGIGGGESGHGGTIYIADGTITAAGGSGSYSGGAGIGGGEDGGAGSITIANSRKTVATGGYAATGIGGGLRGDTGSVNIKDGTVEATGGSYGPGIGSGQAYSSGTEKGVSVTIDGGNVTAKGGDQAAGIGGGRYAISGKIVVNAGAVNATGGNNGAPGIGSGYRCGKDDVDTVDVTINGGTVEARAGRMTGRYYTGAAIGTGGLDYTYDSDAGKVTHQAFFIGGINFNGGTVYAYGADTDEGYENLENSQNVIGTTNDENLTKGIGWVNFNGATVYMYPGVYNGKYSQAVRANSDKIAFGDKDDVSQAVRYAQEQFVSDYVPTSERLNVVTGQGSYANAYEVVVEPKHSHNFTYTLSDDKKTITATCTENCSLTDHKATLTIAAPQHSTYGDGKSPAAAITDADSIGGDAKVKYYKATKDGESYAKFGSALAAAPTDAGDYVAEITLGSGNNTATAYVGYTVAKAPSPVRVTGDAYVQTGGSVELADYIKMNGATGVVTYEVDTGSGCAISENKLVVENDAQEGNVTVSVKVAEDVNYLGTETSITAKITGKIVLTINAEDVVTTYAKDGEVTIHATVVNKDGTEPTGDYGKISYPTDPPTGNEYLKSAEDLSNTLKILKAGTTYVSVSVGGNDQYASVFKDVKVTINKAEITPVIADGFTSWTYGGTATKPALVANTNPGNGEVTYEYKPKSADESAYTTTVPTRAGAYNVRAKVAETDNYLGGTSEPVEFTIAKKGVEPTLTAEDKTYDGTTDAKVSATVDAGDLVAGDSLTISGLRGSFENADAGADKKVNPDFSCVKLVGTGAANYTLTLPLPLISSVKATIEKRPATITADSFTKEYGEEDPELTATVSNVVSGDELNYTLKRADGASVGSYDITVTPTEGENPNYAITTVKGRLTITNATLKVSAEGYSAAYDGKPHGITVAVKPDSADAKVYYSEKELTATNYAEEGKTESVTRTDVGTTTVYYYVTVPNFNSVVGYADVEVTKAPATVKTAPKRVEGLAYTGKAQALVTPGVADGGTMQYSLDGEKWSASVPTATEPGTHVVFYRVLGDANHSDSAPKSVTSVIAKADISKAKVELAQASFTYDGKAKQPAIKTVKLGGTTLKAASDFTVAYANNVNAGTATVTVTGKGDYAGAAKATFKIAKADISKAEVALAQTSLAYDGKAKKPAVKFVVLNNTVLKSGTDYAVSYKNNVNVGKATAAATGKGNYTGTAQATFTITKGTSTAAKISIAKAKVTLAKKSLAYDGKAKKPAVKSVVLKGKKLIAEADYTVAYKNNKKLGTATVTVTGKGDYKDSAKATFKIVLGKAKALTIGRGKAKAFEVGWAKVPGAKSYQVQWRERGGKWKSAKVKSTDATVKGMKTGGLYDFRVRAQAGKAKGAWSKQAHRWLARQLDVKAASKKSGTVKATWSKTAKANAGYLVVVRYEKGGKAVAKQKVSAGRTSATVKGLVPGKKAWVQVRALHKAGGATYSGMFATAKSAVKVAGKAVVLQSAAGLKAATL